MKHRLTRREFMQTAAVAVAATGGAVWSRWAKAADKSGNPMPPALRRIDSHAHGWWSGPPDVLRAYIAECRKRGIERIVLIQSEDTLFDTYARCPEFVIPVAQVNIDAIKPDEISRLVERGAKGIKFIGPMHSYGADVYFPLYERLCRLCVPAVFHTGYLMVGLFEKDGRFYEKPSLIDITDMRPAAIDRIVRGFPSLKILMAHFGNPWWEETWKMISTHRNVYADLSGGTAYRRSMLMWSEMFAPDGKLDVASAGKLCFGSDAGYFAPDRYSFLDYVAFYERFFDRVGMPENLREKINRGNMLELFGLKA
ncbi:MAG: amidohydrolase family protein [Verrucomicrobiia bacterium]